MKKYKIKAFDINGDGVVDFNDIKAIFTGERYHQPSTIDSLISNIKTLWEKQQPTFDALSAQIQKRQRLLKGSLIQRWIFGSDSKIEKTLLKLTLLFDDERMIAYRQDFRSITKKISVVNDRVSALRAEGEISGTPKVRSIRSLESDIAALEARRNLITDFFIERLASYEIVLTKDEAESLLSRVDADDICQLITIFFTITQISNQLERAKIASGENLKVSKQYYAVFIGLLETQILVQDNYIKRVDAKYLPATNQLLDTTKSLYVETKQLAAKAQSEHISSYQKNLAAQELTLAALNLYRDQLITERDSIVSARAMVNDRLKLAINTYDTVTVAGELTEYLRQSDSLYLDVMSLQTPVMSSFENTQLKGEYQKISSRLRDMINL
jgi:hypothetical protein